MNTDLPAEFTGSLNLASRALAEGWPVVLVVAILDRETGKSDAACSITVPRANAIEVALLLAGAQLELHLLASRIAGSMADPQDFLATFAEYNAKILKAALKLKSGLAAERPPDGQAKETTS
ncbi:MAG: hypothetical protein NTU94_13075 [Planctomycetota bacterium]|nr:hypothetical protein [Planctomycetota bacterium]